MEIRPISIQQLALAGAAALGLFLAQPVTATAQNLFMVTGDINTIEQFIPGGVGSVFANRGLTGPAYLAFGPVPEPFTWTLLDVGVGLLDLTPRDPPVNNDDKVLRSA